MTHAGMDFGKALPLAVVLSNSRPEKELLLTRSYHVVGRAVQCSAGPKSHCCGGLRLILHALLYLLRTSYYEGSEATRLALFPSTQ